MRQTGATGIITALHDIPYEAVWEVDEIQARKALLKASGFEWHVCESLPVNEDIKRGTANAKKHLANYRQSLANLAAEGIKTVCYNFMPVLDWPRTDLKAPVANGGTCLRFDATKMTAFELCILGRDAAEGDYPADTIAAALNWYADTDWATHSALLETIMTGMPGAFDRYDLVGLRDVLKKYADIGRAELRENFSAFLRAVIPTAEELGLRLCVHPDDPPRNILGLPRIVSTAQDIAWVLGEIDSPSNGLTLCSGSLGTRLKNDPVAIAKAHADKIHFAHLRNVRKEPDGSFEEAEHLTGDTDMVALVTVLLAEEKRRLALGQNAVDIPFRPDHGHDFLNDKDRDYIPGYPIIGRLRGLAELRGVIMACSKVGPD